MITVRRLVASDLNDFVRLMIGFYEYSGEKSVDVVCYELELPRIICKLFTFSLP